MKLFQRKLQRREEENFGGRLAALEDYVEYLRQQGEYGIAQADKRLDDLEARPRGG